MDNVSKMEVKSVAIPTELVGFDAQIAPSRKVSQMQTEMIQELKSALSASADMTPSNVSKTTVNTRVIAAELVGFDAQIAPSRKVSQMQTELIQEFKSVLSASADMSPSNVSKMAINTPLIAAELVGFDAQISPSRKISQMKTEVIPETKTVQFGGNVEVSPTSTASTSTLKAAIANEVPHQEPPAVTVNAEEVVLRSPKTAPVASKSLVIPELRNSVEGNLDTLFGTTPPDYDKDKHNGEIVATHSKFHLRLDDGLDASKQSAASPSARVDYFRELLQDIKDISSTNNEPKLEIPITQDGEKRRSAASKNSSQNQRLSKTSAKDEGANGGEPVKTGGGILYASLAFSNESEPEVGPVEPLKEDPVPDFTPLVARKVAALLTASCGPWKPLHRASQCGSASLAEALLDAGADLECQNPGGGRPLHVAAQRGSTEVVRLLLARGVSLEAKDKSGWRPLHFAVGNAHPEVAALLIDAGATMECGGGKKGVRPLHMAVNLGHLCLVSLLATRGAMLEGESQSGLRPLHLAAQGGNLEMTRALLDHGALVNGEDRSGVRPLYLAAHRGHVEVVRLLLKRGANPDHISAKGMTPLLTAAMQKDHHQVATLLITEGRVNVENALPPFLLRPLHLACAHGHHQMAELLIRHGACVDSHARNGATPLHLAATMGHANVVGLLLERGARVDSLDSRNMTPLHAACAAGDAEVVEVLLRHGATIETRSAENKAPLDMAVANGHVDVIQLLLARGAILSAPAVKPTEAKNMFTRFYSLFRS